jgi:hypothetical protein
VKSVFLVKTPLQLLNAVEAKYHFSLNTRDCVLIIMGDRKSQPQILRLADDIHEWGDVLILNRTSLFFGNPMLQTEGSALLDRLWLSKLFRKSFFYVRRLNRISRYLGEVEYIFAGYARYIYMRHFINMTPHKEVFLLDDGNGTIQLAKERREQFDSVASLPWRKKIKLLGKRYLQGVKDKEAERLGYFTIYDIQSGPNDFVVKNTFEWIRKSGAARAVEDLVYFIGSPVSETRIMSQPDYLKNIAKVRDYYREREFVYIAHRRESKANLDQISRELNIRVINFDFPLEYQLAVVGPKPKILASFVSSALDSCRLILDDDVRIVAFRMDLKDSPMREEIDSIYDHYASQLGGNFSVINL